MAIGAIAIGAAVIIGDRSPAKPLPYVARLTNAASCTPLGKVIASNVSPNGIADLAHAEVRRKVAAKGGNAYVVITEQYNPIASATVIEANAFHCR